MRFCKSCKHLSKVPSRKDGRAISATHPADDYYYSCSWSTVVITPWPSKSKVIKREYGSMIGKRFVEPGLAAAHPDSFYTHEDWDEVMDCPTWEQK